MKNPNILRCSGCGNEVLPRSDGRCPSCQAVMGEPDPAWEAEPSAKPEPITFPPSAAASTIPEDPGNKLLPTSPHTASASTVFYHAKRTYRNPGAIRTVIFSLLTLWPFLQGVIRHLSGQPAGFLPVPLVYLGTAILLNIVLSYLYRMIRDVRELVEINSEGIRSRHNFWYWPQIESIRAWPLDSKGLSYRIRLGLSIDPRTSYLITDTPLSQDQYDRIIDQLKPLLAAQHPNVRLNYARG